MLPIAPTWRREHNEKMSSLLPTIEKRLVATNEFDTESSSLGLDFLDAIEEVDRVPRGLARFLARFVNLKLSAAAV